MSKSIKRNAVAKLLLSILNIVLPIITGPYLARVLDVALYGEYNSANSILAWFLPIASFGIYNYGLRNVSRVKKDQKKASQLFTSLFVMGSISTFIVLAVYIGYIIIFPAADMKLMYAVLGIQIVAQMFYVEWMNEAFENYGFILIKTLVVRSLNVVFTFLLIRRPEDTLLYALLSSLTIFANYLISFVYAKKRIPLYRISKDDLKVLVKPLFIMLLMTNATMFYTALDRFFLSVFSEGKYVTYYVFAMRLATLITQVINAVVYVTLPRLSFYLGEERKDDYKNLLFKNSRMFFMIGIPMCLGIACLGTPIMFIYGGENYIAAGSVLTVFGIRTLFWLCDVSMANQIIFIHGKEAFLTKIYFVCGGINLLLNSLLAICGYVTPTAMIATTAISEFFMVLLEIRCIKRNISPELNVLTKPVFRYLFLAIFFFPIAYGVEKVIGFELVLNMKFFIGVGTIFILCVAFYFGTLFLFKDQALKDSIDMVVPVFLKKLPFFHKNNHK